MTFYEELHEKLYTGHEIIDKQHQDIARSVALFYDHLINKHHKQTILGFLNNSLNLTEAHFLYEEEQMDKTQFIMKHQHKSQHENYLNEIRKMIKDMETDQLDDMQKIGKIIKNWVFNHIIGMDRKLVEHLLII
ncbi:MAG: hypothetical protein A2Y40_07525 [Candidatus Margulisbacteria bacterium GWF2_35_9]|nr:MAG: hypothetical protein A2Y40_07525 [Candidatus Margulisbacteria bacterium GWF2_35_9]